MSETPRQTIGSIICHLKHDVWLGRNNLKGTQGDSMIVLLSCLGHILRVTLKRLRDNCAYNLCCAIFRLIVRLNRALSGVIYGFATLNSVYSRFDFNYFEDRQQSVFLGANS